MSLSKISFGNLVMKQFRYKLKSYIGSINSLVVLQLIAILFSLNGAASSGGGATRVNVQTTYYTADIVIIFTMIWAFMSAVLITTKAYREENFLFVASRLSSHLSNSLFLLATSFLAGIMALLSGFLLKVIIYFTIESEILHMSMSQSFIEVGMGIIATILYIFLASCFGYLLGTIIQLHKTLVILLPGVLLGIIFLTSVNGLHLLPLVGKFYFFESSFLLVLCKVLVSSGVFLLGAGVISNRLEVRQ
ncbi:hypothetical protein KFZ56_03310 [Virgibacillus sp. NKC19-3]|uniref:hypothetical protein n=1 Tax=Virgibacillus saliphilus TaxID=2831674 RepID=UPI001C9BB850|nr:hypothetical protein [Virgibacillus sp. NKC19-3]MBY7142133.1 hypothetical protein [Virgibacillus sp. NKC19-3]